MPNILLQQLENALPEGMQIPEGLRQLYQWIEDNGYYEDGDDGVRYGYLYPKSAFRETYLSDDPNVDIDIAFFVEEENFRKELLTISFGKNADDAAERFLIIAENLYSGSMVALWVDYRGTTQIVRMIRGEETDKWQVVKKQLNFYKAPIRTSGIDIFVPMGIEDNGLNEDFEGWYDAMMYES